MEETAFYCGPVETLNTYATNGNEDVENYRSAAVAIDNYISIGQPTDVMRTEPSPASTR